MVIVYYVVVMLQIKTNNKLDLKLMAKQYARLYGAKVDYWFRTSGSWPKEL